VLRTVLLQALVLFQASRNACPQPAAPDGGREADPAGGPRRQEPQGHWGESSVGGLAVSHQEGFVGNLAWCFPCEFGAGGGVQGTAL